MDTGGYYIPDEKDFPHLAQTLTSCFKDDPLYRYLIPDPAMRAKLLPQLFMCDLEEMLNYCDILADSPDMRGLIVLTDDAEHRSRLKKRWAEKLYELKTDLVLIKADPTMQTLERFTRGHVFLESDWCEKLDGSQLHIIYLAVNPEFHGKGVAHRLIAPVLSYADRNRLTVTLETQNPDNLPMYGHYGFGVYETLGENVASAGNETGKPTEYCLVRLPFGRALDRP